jgi:hypothetical protein
MNNHKRNANAEKSHKFLAFEKKFDNGRPLFGHPWLLLLMIIINPHPAHALARP